MAQWPADAQTDATRAGVSPLAPSPLADLDLSAGTALTADFHQIAIPDEAAHEKRRNWFVPEAYGRR